ncbi:uncharacterized protein LOC142234680 [Haematobia irritans]|uniref:uncharacterized protein LOC142234680 n=1 Tax=Haematobia irritans TaxID=7368 RepID=UPI003F4FC7D8
MVLMKSLVFKLLLLTLIVCCLTSINAAKISKNKTKSVTKTVDGVSTAKAVVATGATDDKDVNNDDDADDEDDFDVTGEADKEDDDDDDDGTEKNTLQTSEETSLGMWSVVRSVWNWIRDDISTALFDDEEDGRDLAVTDERSKGQVEGRTFGKIRRLQMALIPIIFKFGILTAMVAFLVAIAMKTLFLIKVLLVMNALALLGKFFTLKSSLLPMGYSAPPSYSWSPPGHPHHFEYAAPPSWSWSPPSASSSWSSAPVVEHKYAPPQDHPSHSQAQPSVAEQPSKEIHLHIHGSQGQPKVEAFSTYGAPPSNGWKRSDSYGGYETLISSDQNDLSVDATQAVPATVQTNIGSNIPSNHRMF